MYLYIISILIHLSVAATGPFVYADHAPEFLCLVASATACPLTYFHHRQRNEVKQLINAFSDFRHIQKSDAFVILKQKNDIRWHCLHINVLHICCHIIYYIIVNKLPTWS